MIEATADVLILTASKRRWRILPVEERSMRMSTMNIITQDHLTLEFGAICDPIKKQLTDQKFIAHAWKIRAWQKTADSITILSAQLLLTPSQVKSIRQRLLKRIAAQVKPQHSKP